METVGWLVGTDTAKQLDVEVLQKKQLHCSVKFSNERSVAVAQ